MAKQCIVCEKRARPGNLVSHSMRHTKRRFKANLQKVRIILKGKPLRAYVCTRCLKANRVIKAP